VRVAERCGGEQPIALAHVRAKDGDPVVGRTRVLDAIQIKIAGLRARRRGENQRGDGQSRKKQNPPQITQSFQSLHHGGP
jgi:hypothetical protein